MVRRVMLLVPLSMFLSSGSTEALAFDREASLVALDEWSCLFGGCPTELRFEAAPEDGQQGRLGWSLSVFGRTVARGETLVDARLDKAARVAISLDVPPVSKGQILPADLVVELYGPDRAAVAVLEKRLWVCSDDPFAGQTKWLGGLQIRLFDPAGKTREVFRKASIPFSQTGEVDSLVGLQDAMLVVGEGVSLKAYRGLPRMMIEAAGRGVPVLCLAPGDGRIRLPGGADAELSGADRLIFRQPSVIRDLDKRLDAHAWPPGGSVASCNLALASHGGQITADVVEPGEGWPWLGVGFPRRRGKLIVCCFALVEKWDAGPVPRFLLARLLERLDSESSGPPTPKRSASASSPLFEE